ncbi:hypothetical protein H6G91_13500 [Nostoc muscorum FACHB-395]|jgi:hypothetical protein|nr:hypothetical protein [Desmonostoc muscorum FACHB-395]
MAELTLAQVFGTNATQDATTVTIYKADLPRLTPASVNTGESLLTGIILKSQVQLTKTNFDANIDQSIYIESGFPGFAFRGTDNTSYRVDSLTVSLAKVDTSSVIDPDDY